MDVALVTTADGGLLRSVRETIGSADEGLLCVAFASEQGVHLVSRELRGLGSRGRLLVTTSFATTSPVALNMALDLGTAVRVLNPGAGSTYHPKVYLGRGGQRSASVIGSANLTGGLASNVEAAMVVRGGAHDRPLADAWDWAETLWADRRTAPWVRREATPRELPVFDPALHALLEREVDRDPVFMTLGRQPRKNVVADLVPTGAYVRTARSDERGSGGEFVPAWMFNLAWDYLRANGTLTNRFLLDDLNVKRSSAVCAILGRLPPVRVADGGAVTLVWANPAPST